MKTFHTLLIILTALVLLLVLGLVIVWVPIILAAVTAAMLSGRIRMNFVRIVPGDKVKVVLSPYDLTRGRITWRVKS